MYPIDAFNMSEAFIFDVAFRFYIIKITQHQRLLQPMDGDLLSPPAHHSWIAARKSWFGKSSLFCRWTPVFGDRWLPCANHCSMLSRSYVNPSAATTGSRSSSNVKYCQKHPSHACHAIMVQKKRCFQSSLDLSYRPESCLFLFLLDRVEVPVVLIPSFLLCRAIGYMQSQIDSSFHLLPPPAISLSHFEYLTWSKLFNWFSSAP